EEEEEEEEEVVRSVVDIRSDMEQEEPKQRVTRSANRKSQGPPPPPANPDLTRRRRNSTAASSTRRSLRHARSVSSMSSELTVSESESSASPPSLDSRPALKGKSTNHPNVPPSDSLDATNDEKKVIVVGSRGRVRGRGRPRYGRLAVGRNQNSTVSDLVNRVRIIEVEEPVRAVSTTISSSRVSPPLSVTAADESQPSGKLRRSERMAKPEPVTNGTADRALKRAALKEKAAASVVNVDNTSPMTATLGTRMKGRRSNVAAPTAASENDCDTMMTPRAGVAGSKRSLRPRP
ncbi:hypothetical protein FRC16_001878, partial [Serendipita sp. 398]